MANTSFTFSVLRTVTVLLIFLLPLETRSLAQSARTPDPTKSVATNLTGFTVPFEIDDHAGTYLEVHLYVSRNHGRTWKFYAKQDVNADGFQFESSGDGEYWFALKTLNRDRQLIPSGKITAPELRIVVDSEKPKLAFNVESDAAGRVITSWRIHDPHLDSNSLAISHRAASQIGGEETWVPIDFTSNSKSINNRLIDRVAWWPLSSSKRVEVKLEVADAAGNVSSEIQTVTLRNTSIQHNNSNSTNIANQFKPSSKRNYPKTSKKPPNVVCENGVCRIVNDTQGQSGWQNGTDRSVTADDARSHANPGKGKRPTIAQNQYNRTNGWGRRTAARNASANRPVGSPAEYVDPPVPTKYHLAGVHQAKSETKQSSNENLTTRPETPKVLTGGQSSVVWASQKSNWTGQLKTSDASTVQQNDFPRKPASSRRVTGLNQTNNRFKNVPVVERNDIVPQTQPLNQRIVESSSHQQGDMVVSQSTTFGRGKTTNESPIPEATNHSFSDSSPATRNFQPTNSQPQPNGIHHSASHSPPGMVPFAGPANRKSNVQNLFVNTRRFNLNYDVKAINPSGVGRVVLWVTEDGGATWKSWLTDPDNVSPFPVEVQRDGIYGFRVVINSRDGITGKPPKSNDEPDVWVQVDRTTPKVALTSAPYGSGRDVGKLVIHWEAYDQFLKQRPIKLSFSPNEQGPWTTISDRLRNTGSYAWKVPPQVPERIFLRIEAADEANNIGTFQTNSPIDISGLVPRGHIYSIEPIGP